jgi:hypothetical protein
MAYPSSGEGRSYHDFPSPRPLFLRSGDGDIEKSENIYQMINL